MDMAKPGTAQAGTGRTVGRPRRLTLDAIIDAACDIGIADLEMGVLAERLNTGVATLYGYVRGRDHLLELVTLRLAGEALVRDGDQGWQDILRQHAAVTYKLFQSLPHVITNLMGKDNKPQSAHYSQLILDMLTRRDVPMAAAVGMYIEANQVVIGAAVALIRRQAGAQITMDSDGHPAALPAVLGDYRLTLERIIAGYEVLLATGADPAVAALDAG